MPSNKTNPYTKTNPDGYEELRISAYGWDYKVLKINGGPNLSKILANPMASAFVAVKSPHTYGSYERGDTYISEIPGLRDKLLNGLDQCAWFHDRGAWRWNPRSSTCEDQTQCSNTLGLVRCLTAVWATPTLQRHA